MTLTGFNDQKAMKKTVLVTGARGFVGRNLCAQLRNLRDGLVPQTSVEIGEVLEYDIDTDPALLDDYCRRADFVFNLAGVNRPKDPAEFMAGNFGFASTLLDALERHSNRCPVMIASSIQAELDNPYGESKRAGEQLMRDYSRRTGAPVLVYRFPNLFGKWCRPNYNSAVATFCHNIARSLPITVNDPSVELRLVYIDDLVDELVARLGDSEATLAAASPDHIYAVEPEHRVKLGRIVELLEQFSAMPRTLAVPDLTPGGFEKKLYSTWLSYLPAERVAYPLEMHTDARGSFTEVLRSAAGGQVSVNISEPGITKGDHWHHTKTEKFVVVQGRGLIRMRPIDGTEVIEVAVDGDHLTVVDMLPGYTHSIVNLSDTERMVTLMWCNESFDPSRPDTFRLKV